MPTPNFYKTLGVDKKTSADELRKAYRKLAKEYHPDAKPDDEAAAKKFTEIQDAYAVLGNKEKRQQYDQFGAVGYGGGRCPFQGQGRGGAGGVDLNDIFGGQFGGFGDLFGQGGVGTRAAAPRKGEDIRIEIDVSFQVAAEGGNHSVQLRREGNTDRLNVKIPPGVNSGSVIRLAGQGQPGYSQGPPGDLKLVVKIAPHPFFRREGRNLLVDVPITPSEAALGAKVDVPTLTEGNVTLTIPPGTSSGTKLRLKGKGVLNQKSKQRGDQFVVTKIVVPGELDDESQKLYQQLADLPTKSPREGLW